MEASPGGSRSEWEIKIKADELTVCQRREKRSNVEKESNEKEWKSSSCIFCIGSGERREGKLRR